MTQKSTRPVGRRLAVVVYWHHSQKPSQIKRLDAQERRDYEAELKKAHRWTQRRRFITTTNSPDQWTSADLNEALRLTRELAVRAAQDVYGPRVLERGFTVGGQGWNGVHFARLLSPGEFHGELKELVPPDTTWMISVNPGLGFTADLCLTTLRVGAVVEWFDRHKEEPRSMSELPARRGSKRLRQSITTYGVKTPTLLKEPQRPRELRELYDLIRDLRDDDIRAATRLAQSAIAGYAGGAR